jgi:hypothetical protein
MFNEGNIENVEPVEADKIEDTVDSKESVVEQQEQPECLSDFRDNEQSKVSEIKTDEQGNFEEQTGDVQAEEVSGNEHQFMSLEEVQSFQQEGWAQVDEMRGEEKQFAEGFDEDTFAEATGETDNFEKLESLKETFSPENWENLTEGQKLDACMELKDYIKDDLGMESDINISFHDDMDSNVGGTAEKTEHEGTQVEINMDNLDDPQAMVDHISHESYHTYQHEQVYKLDELPDGDETKYKAEGWENDFENQTGDATEDYNLSVEQDARKYAANIGDRLFS